ncbi:MAG: class I SAM-dependent methyltransferase [Chloroflexi bacterium]|nr:class I SAM-dependent methyltransferase [Chloroflexota bacterium]
MPTREEIIVQHVAPFLNSRLHVLEIGAGNGLVAEMLHQRVGARFTLLDVVDYNRSAFPLYVNDGRHLPFPDGSFDVTMLIFVLHHNPDPRPVLREALRVSAQGVLLVENDVRGILKKPITQLLDSGEAVRRGVPRCYFTKSVDEWLALLQEIPARGELLSTFKIGWFWHNAVLFAAK